MVADPFAILVDVHTDIDVTFDVFTVTELMLRSAKVVQLLFR